MNRKIFLLVLFMICIDLLNAKEYYPKTQQPDFLLFHATPAISLLQYKSEFGNSIPSPTVGFGVEYAHFFHRRIGLSIGGEMNTFGGFYLFSGRKDSLTSYDSWSSRNFMLRQQLNTKEYQSVSYMSIPIKIILRHLISPSMNLSISAGAAYNFYLKETKSIIVGSVYRQAYFPDINVVVDDFLPLTFGRFNDYVNPSPLKQFTKTTTGIFQIGITNHFNTKWVAHASLNFMYGMDNIKLRKINLLSPNEYSGVTATNYIGEIKPYSLGIRLGLSYNFDLFEADCHCTNTWW